MDCKTTLDPPVANTWYKQGGVLPADATQTNGQLTIPDVKGEDAGTYICTSKSPVGTIDIPTTLIVTGNSCSTQEYLMGTGITENIYVIQRIIIIKMLYYVKIEL